MLGLRAADNEAADHDVVASLDKAARGDVGRIRRCRLIDRKKFDQANARATLRVAQNYRVGARIEMGEEGGFEVIVRRESGIRDCVLVRALHPIVVSRKDCARTIVQLDLRVGQRARNGLAIYLQRRSEAAQNKIFAGTAGDDETTNQHIVARLNSHPGGEIKQRWRGRDRHDLVHDAAVAGRPEVGVAENIHFTIVIGAEAFYEHSKFALGIANAQFLDQAVLKVAVKETTITRLSKVAKDILPGERTDTKSAIDEAADDRSAILMTVFQNR